MQTTLHRVPARAALPAEATTRKIADLPSPPGLPWIGNAHQVRPSTLHLTLERWFAELGGPYAMRLGPRRVVVMANAGALQTALRSRPEQFRRSSPIESVFAEMGANGVFSVEGPAWNAQRRLVMQALSPAQLRGFHPTLMAITRRLLKRWSESAAAGRVVEMTDDLTRYTVDVTTALAFGEDPNTLESDGDVIQRHLAQVFPTIMRRVNAPFPWWRHVRLPADRRFDASMAAVHAHVRGLIERARERLKSEPATAPRNVLEAMLVQAVSPDSPLADADVQANVITLLLAGEDTTAHTLAWTLHHLALHPQWQDHLHDKARAVLGDADVCPTLEQLAELDAFEACATEATRLKPIVPLFYMETRTEVVLDGVRLPAATPLICVLRPPMLDERHFWRAAEYRPERWLAAAAGCPVHEGRAHDSRAWAQFGAGPRVCPGRHLAGNEIRLVLSMLMRHFRIEHGVDPASIRERNAFTMAPERMPLRLVPRQPQPNLEQRA
ncbi:MAG: cytochrome P450 [Rubrivivax sp.]|nr:cytochrome P450 [Rubrivivax sp.]